MIVDENSFWNWKKQQVEKCSSSNKVKFIYVVANDDVKANDDEEVSDDSPSWSKSNSSSDDDKPLNPKMKSLTEIYEGCKFTIEEPICYEEATKEEGWVNAMNEELNMIEKNGTWDLVPRPNGRNVIGLKWFYWAKLNLDNSLNKIKARLVVKGYAQ